jgi:hypothetical protein
MSMAVIVMDSICGKQRKEIEALGGQERNDGGDW